MSRIPASSSGCRECRLTNDSMWESRPCVGSLGWPQATAVAEDREQVTLSGLLNLGVRPERTKMASPASPVFHIVEGVKWLPGSLSCTAASKASKLGGSGW